MCGNRLNAWNTIPIPRRTWFTSTPGAVISSPSTTMLPLSIGSSRLMQRSSVDLPEPDAPIRQITSCSSTDRSMPFSTSSLPNDLCTSLQTSAGAAVAHTRPPAIWRLRSRAISQSVSRACGIVISTKKNAATT